MHRTVSRRRFLAGGLAVIAAAVAPSLVPSGPLATWRDDPVAARLRSLVDSPSVRRLGRAQLNSLPSGRSAFEISREVIPLPFDPESVLEATRENLVDALGHQIIEDFRHGQQIAVEGWFVSTTEAKLALLTVIRR